MSNKNGRNNSNEKSRIGYGLDFVTSDFGRMRYYGLTCINKTARRNGMKPYVNVYSRGGKLISPAEVRQ